MPHPGTKQRRGPLKLVTRLIRRPAHQFDQGTVLLECGHMVRSNSIVGHRARCGTCPKVEKDHE